MPKQQETVTIKSVVDVPRGRGRADRCGDRRPRAGPPGDVEAAPRQPCPARARYGEWSDSARKPCCPWESVNVPTTCPLSLTPVAWV